MLTLGEQLILVALDADKGAIRGSGALQYGLNAAALAELLGRGLVTLRRPDGSFGVTPVEGAAGQELEGPLLTAVWKQLQSTPEGQRHPDMCVRTWHEPGLHAYLKVLRSGGVIDWERPKDSKARYGRFRLLDSEAAAAARARVDRVRTGAEPDDQDRDLAGIAGVLGFGAVLYSGLHGRSKRAALSSAIEKQRFVLILARALPQAPGEGFTFDNTGNSSFDASNYTDV